MLAHTLYLMALFNFGFISTWFSYSRTISIHFPRKSFNVWSLSFHPKACQQCSTLHLQFSFKLQWIIPIRKYRFIIFFKRSHLDANQSELSFPHFLHSDAKQSHKQKFETLKTGVEGSTAIRKTMRASAKSMTWMKQMDEGKWKWLGCDLWQAVRNQCQLLWMGNRCWANEKKKKREERSRFFFHPPSKNN